MQIYYSCSAFSLVCDMFFCNKFFIVFINHVALPSLAKNRLNFAFLHFLLLIKF